MSRLNQEKANDNFCKFVENTQRITGKTLSIINRLISEDKTIKNSYSDVPGLLQIALDIIPKSGNGMQMQIISGFIDEALIKESRDSNGNVINICEMVKNKDDKILTEHLGKILSNNPYVERIQYIYGANPSKKCYVNEAEVNIMWKLITAIFHNSIKYVIFSENPKFFGKISKSAVTDLNVNLD